MPGKMKSEITPTIVVTEVGQVECNLLEKVKEKQTTQTEENLETGGSNIRVRKISSPAKIEMSEMMDIGDEDSNTQKKGKSPTTKAVNLNETSKDNLFEKDEDKKDEVSNFLAKTSLDRKEDGMSVEIKSSPTKPAESDDLKYDKNLDEYKHSPMMPAVVSFETKADMQPRGEQIDPTTIYKSIKDDDEPVERTESSPTKLASVETNKVSQLLEVTSTSLKSAVSLDISEDQKLVAAKTLPLKLAVSQETNVDNELIEKTNGSPEKPAIYQESGIDKKLEEGKSSSTMREASHEGEGNEKVTEETFLTKPAESGNQEKEVAECPLKNVKTTNEKMKSADSSPVKSEAFILLAQGKRHIMVKDYASAVDSLESACAKMSEMYGEFGNECADAYFAYGRALLELVREDSALLGDAVGNKDEKSDNDEDDGDDDDDDDEEGNADIKVGDKANDGVDNKEGDKIKVTENGDDKVSDENEEEKEEDVSNLQIAWEILEMAKKIYERQNDEAKLAETYLLLGEVGLESASYATAIEDMKSSLEIKKKISLPESREIAQTLFQLGIACSLCNHFEEAIEYYSSCSKVIESRIEHLLKQKEPDPENIRTNPFYTVEKEIEELKALLPVIREKIVDMEDYKTETMKALMEATGKAPAASAGEAGPSGEAQNELTSSVPAKPAVDISHLIRKKRKPEDMDSVDSEPSLKQACIEQPAK